MAGQVGPDGFEREAFVVAGLAQRAQEGPEILAVHAGCGAVLVFREMGVADDTVREVPSDSFGAGAANMTITTCDSRQGAQEP